MVQSKHVDKPIGRLPPEKQLPIRLRVDILSDTAAHQESDLIALSDSEDGKGKFHRSCTPSPNINNSLSKETDVDQSLLDNATAFGGYRHSQASRETSTTSESGSQATDETCSSSSEDHPSLEDDTSDIFGRLALGTLLLFNEEGDPVFPSENNKPEDADKLSLLYFGNDGKFDVMDDESKGTYLRGLTNIHEYEEDSEKPTCTQTLKRDMDRAGIGSTADFPGSACKRTKNAKKPCGKRAVLC
ncbi:hypothetical protein B0O99DRAFT_681896 [Bisporella sp. PMI_857]|nr:hypothetical protein B0O99DRAFT_681896 [Bisporella sp. PMI_857]